MSGNEGGGTERKISAAMRRESCIGRCSDGQNQVITTEQLLRCGVSESSISRRVRAGRRFRKHHGVYAVGRPDLSPAGIFHGGDLARACRTTWHGDPTTTAPHAVLDLAASPSTDEVFARTLHEAEVQNWVTHEQLRTELERHPTHPGRARLERELGWGPTPTRSPPEDRLVDLLRRRGFTNVETNARIAGLPRWIEVDVLFPAHKLVIAVDGDRFRRTHYRRKRDARKRAIVEAAGLRVIRLVPDDVEPEREAETVTRLRHAIPEG
jgi:very-short-patch-repair endonuclease